MAINPSQKETVPSDHLWRELDDAETEAKQELIDELLQKNRIILDHVIGYKAIDTDFGTDNPVPTSVKDHINISEKRGPNSIYVAPDAKHTKEGVVATQEYLDVASSVMEELLRETNAIAIVEPKDSKHGNAIYQGVYRGEEVFFVDMTTSIGSYDGESTTYESIRTVKCSGIYPE